MEAHIDETYIIATFTGMDSVDITLFQQQLNHPIDDSDLNVYEVVNFNSPASW